jgi:hypothetical protein
VGWTGLLILALTQTSTVEDGVAAQLAFHRGAQLRADGHPSEAAIAFRLAAQRLEANSLPPSPALAFKAGNAWFLAGDLPRAIVAYRRGLVLDPGDNALRAALDYARVQVRYPPGPDVVLQLLPERDYWPRWLTLRRFGGYAFAAYFATCLAATRWRMTRRRRWLIVAVAPLIAAAVPIIGNGIESWQGRCDAAEPIVVVARDEPLRTGNGIDYPPKLELPRGCEVRRLFERGGWLQVRTGGGVVGWVPANAFVDGEKIPSASRR